MEPQLVVNGKSRAAAATSADTSRCWSGCAIAATPAARRAAPRASAGPARFWSPSRTATSSTRWTAINACLVPAAGLDGQEVVTAEGLGQPGDLHTVQQEMAVRGGSQCGYCTPGLHLLDGRRVLPRRPSRPPRRAGRPETEPATEAAAERRPERRRPTAPVTPDHEHGPNGFDLHSLSGNLCRCTGYRPIRDAAYALGRRTRPTRSSPGWTQPAPAPVATARPTATRARSSGRPTWPRPSTCWPSTRTRCSSPARPTGASSSTSGTRGRRSPSASTGWRSCASLDRHRRRHRHRRRADAVRDRA